MVFSLCVYVVSIIIYNLYIHNKGIISGAEAITVILYYKEKI